MINPINHNEGWEKQALERLALASLQEERRARHWGILLSRLPFSIYSLFYSLD